MNTNQNINLSTADVLNMITMFKTAVEKSVKEPVGNELGISSLAAYLLSKADYQVNLPDGTPISKSDLDETTLDFTRGRTLSEEEAKIAIRYIYDTNPYLSLFNTRIVNKLVTPVEGTAITQKNLISNEQNGAAVAVINKRIVHNFGVNLVLKHAQLQKDIPLQSVIDNLYNPGWEQGVINDVAIALGNDILLLAINGLGGNYASTEDFYDLNLGMNKMLQVADGKNTNTYGSVQVVGFLGRYLTPQKVDAAFCTGANYTAANLLALLRKMYKMMPKKYRDNPNNAFLMSQADVDLYVDSRSDMTSPSNTTREQVLNTGEVPRFMGKPLIAVPGWLGINETHESLGTLYGSIVYGDPKNYDIASDSTTYRKNTQFNARAALGPAFEYTYDMYLDFQAAKPESFVIAFKDATLSAPVVVTPTGAAGGSSGEFTIGSLNHYDCAANAVGHVCCDNADTVVVYSTTSDDLEESTWEAAYAAANGNNRGGIVLQNGALTFAADTYIRAYHKYAYAVKSAKVTVNQT